MSGQLVAQLINFLSLPVLARLYGPESFGAFAVFSSFVWIFAVIATGQAEHLIITMRTRRRARALTSGIVIFVFFLSILLALLFDFVISRIDYFKSIKDISYLAVYLGVTVFFIGNNQVLRYYATYVGRFNRHGVSAVFMSIGTMGVSIGYAYFYSTSGSPEGLIIGQMAGLLFSLVPFLYLKNNGSIFNRNSLLFILKVFICQINKVPTFLITHLSKTVHTRLPVIIVGHISGGAAGSYAMAERLLSAPTGLLGQSIGQVFRNRFKSYNLNPKLSQKQPRKVISLTFIVAIFSYGLFIYLADWFVLIVLGDAWLVAIPFLKIIAVMEMLNLVYYSVEDVAVIRNDNFYRMIWQMSQLFIILAAYSLLFISNSCVQAEYIVAILCLIRVLFVLFDLRRTWKGCHVRDWV